jgi:hypothetical protein
MSTGHCLDFGKGPPQLSLQLFITEGVEVGCGFPIIPSSISALQHQIKEIKRNTKLSSDISAARRRGFIL